MQQRPPSRAGTPSSRPTTQSGSGSGSSGGLPPRRPGSPGRGGGGFRIDDRVILASVLVVLGASLVLFASLIVSGAGKFGGDDDPEPDNAALDAGLVGGGSTPAPTSAAAPSAPPTVAPGTDSGAQPTDDSPTVCIDVGHGGVDLGNVRLSEDGSEILLMEKDLVLDIALDLRERLEAQGVGVVLTRETDTEVNADFADVNGDGEVSEDVDGDGVINPDGGEDIVNNLDEQAARVNVCNAAGADLLFSIHANSSGNPELGGVETYWAEDENLTFVEESEEAATLAYEKLTEAFAALGFEPGGRGAAPDHTWEPIDDGDDPRNFDHYIVLSPDRPERNFVGPKMPAVIVECLFVSNDDDYAFLTDDPDAARGAIVTAYEETILEYFETEPATRGADQTEGAAEAVPTPTPEASVDEEDAEETPEAGDDDADSAEVDRTDFDAVAEANNLPPPLPDSGSGASQVHYYGDSGRKEIALTFDLGSDRGYAEEILDFLKERGIRASFGVMGTWAEENPDLIQRMVDEGHQLFNHTWDHQSFTGASTGAEPLTREERIEEIQRTGEIVYELTGYEMAPYFRLPYGDGSDDPQVMEDIYSAGYYLTIMWTCDSYGWKQWTPAEIIQHCREETGIGGIVLMHVGSDGTDQDALPGLVDEFAADGYDFVTIAEVLAPAEEDDA